MSALGPYLRQVSGGALSFHCPGCDTAHTITVGEGPAPRWGFNGDPASPTFTPSILVRQGHHARGHQKDRGCWCDWPDKAEFPDLKCGVCHSFVTDGQIQFLTDCTHALAGQTVPLPPWPSEPDEAPERDERFEAGGYFQPTEKKS